MFLCVVGFAVFGSWPAAVVAVSLLAAYVLVLFLGERKHEFDTQHPEVDPVSELAIEELEVLKKEMASLRAQQQLRMLKPGMRE